MATIEGTAGADTLNGTADADTINGQGGNDTLAGLGGNDRVVGGAGADTLDGGDGDDRLYSHTRLFGPNEEFDPGWYPKNSADNLTETDILNGGAGDDEIFAGIGDSVDGGTGTDTLSVNFLGATSGVNADFRLLATQASIVVGGATISSIESTSYIEGSNFDDVLGLYQEFPNGDAVVYGNGGNDQIFVTLQAGIFGPQVFGGDGDDLIDARGTTQGGDYFGGAGNNTIYTDYGNAARAVGGDGNDTLHSWGSAYGQGGNDQIVVYDPLDASGPAPGADGGDGNDHVSVAAGSSEMYSLSGGAGADVVTGGDGNDYLSSSGFVGNAISGEDNGTEQDQLSGGAGGDHLSIGYGDSANGGADGDVLQLSLAGAPGGVTLNTASLISGAPFVLGGGTIQNIEYVERLYLTGFADTVTIAPASATPQGRIAVFGGNGNDTFTDAGNYADIIGGDGDDRFTAGAQQDYFHGGAGTDTVDYSPYQSGVTVSLQNGSGPDGGGLSEVENVDGSAFVDSLTGDSGTNVLQGNNGADMLSGLFGNDQLDGGAGDDELDGGEGNDTLTGGSGNDSARFSSATAAVTVNLSLGSAQATGQGTDTFSSIEGLTGSAHNDTLTGNGSANRLEGAAGNDVLDGGVGNDTLVGGLGDDTFFVDSLGDVVLEFAGEGIDTLVTPFDTNLNSHANFENLTLAAGAGNRSGTGTAGVNVITGNEGANLLNGGGGNDTLIGGLSDDMYYVDSAGDVVVEAAGGGAADRIFASASYALGGAVHVERLTTNNNGGTGAINLTGNELANLIYGNAGANTLNGGGGADAMVGFGGNDAYFVDNALDTVSEAAGGGTDDRVFASVSFTLAAGASVERMFTNDNAGTAAINLTGNELINVIQGNAGANVLNGKGGADTLSGLGGNDWYYVDSAADVVVEGAGQGASDRVLASVSYTLAAGVQVEVLTTDNNAGTAAIGLTGNEFGNAIYGNAGANALSGMGGNDSLIGGMGADTMAGGAGDDLFYVDNTGDVVVEAAGAGNDRVLASVSFTLTAGVHVELLTTDNNAGTAVIDLTGNELANYIAGNAGANVLDGRGGADALTGLGGNDWFFIDNTFDTVVEGAGEGTADRILTGVSHTLGASVHVELLTTDNNAGTAAINLTGNQFANIIYGNAGANVLDGKGGADTLTGLGGADTFRFSTALGADNVDIIDGFSVADDTIQLDDAVFTGLAVGGLAAGAFNTGAAATQADDRIVYDGATGALLFDADGSGAGAVVQFATLAAGLALTSADFLVI